MCDEKPVVVSKQPSVLSLQPGVYWWCSCGKSVDQPFCDGSHKGSNFTPQKVELTEEKNIALCNCKQSENGAFCDGTHSRL